MAVIAGALAVQQALGSGPPPANFILAGISGAAAAIEVGVIASTQPKFHAGGYAPDEVDAKVMPGEQVISRQGVSTFGRQGERANAGMSPGPSMVAVNLRLRHSVMDTVMAEVNQRGGQFSQGLASTRTAPYGARTDTWRR
jgi:UPF0716 family protein affecting phage T7 exclusion